MKDREQRPVERRGWATLVRIYITKAIIDLSFPPPQGTVSTAKNNVQLFA